MTATPPTQPARFVAVPPGRRPSTVALPPHPSGEHRARTRRTISSDDAAAFGSLAPFVVDGEVTDLFVNGPGELYVDRGDGARREPTWATAGEEALRALAVRIIARGGRHLDESKPNY